MYVFNNKTFKRLNEAQRYASTVVKGGRITVIKI